MQHVLEDWGEAHTSTVAREVLAKIEEVVETACGTLCVPLPILLSLFELTPFSTLSVLGQCASLPAPSFSTQSC